MTHFNRDIALYCRVSTDEQAREGISLDEQKERLKMYCGAMGWTEEPRLFIEDGYSAKNLERPQLTKLLNEVQNGTISKILVTKLDRLSRKLLDLLTLIELFQGHKVAFISIGESFDTNTPSGRLTLQVLGAVAEFERERIRERVFENMMHAASQGKWLTRYPYGYRLQNKELVVHESEAAIVKDIFDLYIEKGFGYYKIAKYLNEEGIPSRENKEWSLRSVKLILTNPVYKGTLVWNRTDKSKEAKEQLKDEDEWITIDNAVPAIISTDLWEKAQEKTTEKKIAPRAKTSPHLLGGILRCGKCGASMAISWSGSPSNRKRVYRCSAYKNKGTCKSQPYPADEIELWFKQGMANLEHSLDRAFVLALQEIANVQKAQSLAQKLSIAKSRYKRKVEAYTAGLIELKDLEEEKKRLEEHQSDVEKEALSVGEDVDLSEVEIELNKKIKNIIDAIDHLPIDDAKSLIRTLVDKVIIHEKNDIEIALKLP
jgi:site-specific DNA recombinase